MNRLGKKEKKKIISLIKERKSLNYISKLTNRNKSTLYHYYKKILGKKLRDLNIDEKDDDFIGELIGLFVGDGYCFYDISRNQYSIRFYFNKSENKYVDDLVTLFYERLGKKPAINQVKNVLVLRFYSKKLFNFILKYVGWGISINRAGHNKKSRTVFLKNSPYSRKFKIGFLRGFMDSDGHISSKKMNFASASKKIMNQTNSFLIALGFKDFNYYFYKEKRPNMVGMYHLDLNKSERNKVFHMIQPRNLVKLKTASVGGRTRVSA